MKDKYTRSNSYRRDYLNFNKGYKSNGYNYHCSYCGKKITKGQMQVDHIISVYNAKNKLTTRIFMWLFGLKGVNDVKNLTSSCKKCNYKKGKMGNGWVLAGFLGKSIWYHRFKTFVKLLLLIGIIHIIVKYGGLL